MEGPTAKHGREAYVPPEPDTGEDEWPPASREIAIEWARRQRLEDGLPVDGATLERLADAVMRPGYAVPGLFRTPEELADAERIDEEYLEAIDDYLRRHPEIDGGTRLGWRDGRRALYVGLVGEAEVHQAALSRIGGDRIAFEQVPRTMRELEAICDRIEADDEALVAAGFEFLEMGLEPERGVVLVDVVGGRDAAAAERYFAERYGDAVAIEWLGPSPFEQVPHPFGSWTSEGRLLRVFFGLDLNGQRRGSARVPEECGERVVVALTCLQPVGPTTMIGGFSRHHADVELRAPVGDRAVIDASAGVPRPSLAQLRER